MSVRLRRFRFQTGAVRRTCTCVAVTPWFSVRRPERGGLAFVIYYNT